MSNYRKTPLQHTIFAFLLFCSLTSAHSQAGEVLWNLTFKDLPAGKTLTEVPFTPDCTGPQVVIQSAQDGLVGAQKVNGLPPALLFTKQTKAKYTPSLTLKSNQPYTQGIITVTFEVTFDQITPADDKPVETLIAVPFINAKGGNDFIPMFVCEGATSIFVGGANLKEATTKISFSPGEVIRYKAVLDLNKHSFQAFVNDQPLAEEERDDTKFASFLGLIVRDGTAVGGNNGATFSARLANLLIKRD